MIVQTKRLKNDILLDVGEKYSSKIHVIGNPLDIDFVRSKMEEKLSEEFLKKIENKKVICFTASFKSSKNHINLIKSFKILKKKIPNSVLLLIGGDGEQEYRIKQIVKSSFSDDDVIFIGKTSNPFKYEKISDVFILPSLYEGIPNVLIEALAVGLPIISTDCPSGPKEILYENPDLKVLTKGIEKADFGILVEQFPKTENFEIDNILPQNVILAEAMEEILVNEKLNNEYRLKSKNRAKKYGISEYKKQLESLIMK